MENIGIAAEIIKNGGLVIYPTDTVYGLGCDPLNVRAVERLIHLKGERTKPLPILAATLKDVERVAIVSKRAERLAERFWPGAMTLVLRKRKKALPDIVSFGLKTIGVRIPNHSAALKLIRSSGGIIIGTSANKTGTQPPSSATEACEKLEDGVDIVLDGGVAMLGVSSTVVDPSGRRAKILRRGSISLEEILEAEQRTC